MEERLQGEVSQATFDITGRGSRVTGGQISEIALLLDEVVLVGQNHQGVTDGRISVGMEFHGFADDTGDLVKTAIVHGKEGMKNPPLNGLEPVAQFWDGTIEDEIARIFEEIPLHQGFELGHGYASFKRRR
jgi:hypothetical protein